MGRGRRTSGKAGALAASPVLAIDDEAPRGDYGAMDYAEPHELVPPVDRQWLHEQRVQSRLRTGAQMAPTADRWLNPDFFVPMTKAEGRDFLTRLLTHVQKVRSNLAEAQTAYLMDTDEYERRFGPFDENQLLVEYAPRLFGPEECVSELVDLVLKDDISPIDVYNVMLRLSDDHVLKVHLHGFDFFRRPLPALSGWSDE